MAAKSMDALVIPRPSDVLPADFPDRVRVWADRTMAMEELRETDRRLAALHGYLVDRNQRVKVEAARRWVEVRIGQLLGPGKPGPQQSSHASEDSISKDERHRFRLMADHEDVVSSALADGVVSRRQILDRIGRTNGAPKVVDIDARVVADLADLSGEEFGTIYADPPWLYSNQGTRAATSNHYQGMAVEQIAALPIGQLAAPNAHLHLWTTNAFLFQAANVIEAWGFEYKSCFVWVKRQMGIGNYWRVSHEFLLLGTRGQCPFAIHNQRSWLECPRGRHSSKPTKVRNLIEQASPGPRLELFGRSAVRGWTVWGNEVSRCLFTQAETA